MSRITLGFDQDKLSIIGQLSSPGLRASAPVKFMIDTGSPITVLSLRDAEVLDLDFAHLPRYPVKTGGYGGAIELRMLEHAMIVFSTDDLKAKSVEMSSVCVQYSQVKALREKRLLYGVPTVIGTNLLTAGGFTLWADWKLKQAHLDF